MGLRAQEPLALIGLLLLVVAVVHPVFDNGFVYDDVDMIEWGDVVHDPANLWKFYGRNTMYASPSKRDAELTVDTYRPVTMTSFVWDSALSGRRPWAYHLTNLVAHLFCTGLVFVLIRGFVGPRAWPFALFGAAWFGLSPHPNTAQIWINGRSDLFATFFGLVAILAWRHALTLDRKPRFVLVLASAAVFLLGLLSKEVLIAALVPLLFWPDFAPELNWKRRITRCWGFVTASGVYLTLRAWVLGGMVGSAGADHISTAIGYLGPLQWEGLLGSLYPRRLYLRFLSDEFQGLSRATLFLLAALLVFITALLATLRQRLPLVAWGALWFASCLAPVAIITPVLWPGFGRYLYLPAVGLAVALATLARHAYARFPPLRVVFVAAAAAYLGVFAVSLRGWVEDFRDEEALYLSAIEHNPGSPHGYGWLGMSRAVRGQLDEAIGPLAVAHRIAPEVPRYAEHLLEAFIQTGRLPAARKLAKEAAPRYEHKAAKFHLFLLEQSHESDPEQATFEMLECLRKAPGSAPCGKAFTHLVTQHPRRDEHRVAARVWLQKPEFSDVRRQTAPLLDSLQ